MGQSTSKFSGELCIPFDVLNLILDSFDHPTLKLVSTLNRNINHEINKRLWYRVAFAYAGYLPRRKRRRSIMQCCNAVIRDPRRARCIRAVRIHLYLPVARWRISVRSVMRKICTALEFMTRLHTLDVDSSVHPKELARALSRHSYKFVFSLKTLRTTLTIADGIMPFLASQPEVQHYKNHWENLHHYGAYDPHTVDVEFPRTLFPSLREVCVTGSLVRSLVLGRTLDSVHISSECTLRDLTRSLGTSSVADAERSIVRHLEFSTFFPSSHDRHIPALIGFWGISETAICSLKICAERMPSQFDLPSILVHFTSLKWLEWASYHGYEFSMTPFPLIMDDDWCAKFIKECSRHSPSLERVTFTQFSGISRDWVVQYVPDTELDVYHGKGIWTLGGKFWKAVHNDTYIPK